MSNVILVNVNMHVKNVKPLALSWSYSVLHCTVGGEVDSGGWGG